MFAIPVDQELSRLDWGMLPFHGMAAALVYLLSFIFSRLLLNLNNVRTLTECLNIGRKANYYMSGAKGPKGKCSDHVLFSDLLSLFPR